MKILSLPSIRELTAVKADRRASFHGGLDKLIRDGLHVIQRARRETANINRIVDLHAPQDSVLKQKLFGPVSRLNDLYENLRHVLYGFADLAKRGYRQIIRKSFSVNDCFKILEAKLNKENPDVEIIFDMNSLNPETFFEGDQAEITNVVNHLVSFAAINSERSGEQKPEIKINISTNKKIDDELAFLALILPKKKNKDHTAKELNIVVEYKHAESKIPGKNVEKAFIIDPGITSPLYQLYISHDTCNSHNGSLTFSNFTQRAGFLAKFK